MAVPIGFAAISVPLVHTGLARASAVTFAVKNDLGTTAAVVAETVQEALDAHFVERLDTQVTCGPVVAYLGASGGSIPGLADHSTAGGLSINSPPPNVAVLAKKITSTTGRHGRGRMFLPWFIDKGSIDENGNLDGTQRGNIAAVLEALLERLVDDELPMYLLHANDSAPSVVLQLPVDSLVATQRKRLGR